MKMKDIIREDSDPSTKYFIYVRCKGEEVVAKIYQGEDEKLYVRPLRASPANSTLPSYLLTLYLSPRMSKEQIVNKIKNELSLSSGDKVWFVDKTFHIPYNHGE